MLKIVFSCDFSICRSFRLIALQSNMLCLQESKLTSYLVTHMYLVCVCVCLHVHTSHSSEQH